MTGGIGTGLGTGFSIVLLLGLLIILALAGTGLALGMASLSVLGGAVNVGVLTPARRRNLCSGAAMIGAGTGLLVWLGVLVIGGTLLSHGVGLGAILVANPRDTAVLLTVFLLPVGASALAVWLRRHARSDPRSS